MEKPLIIVKIALKKVYFGKLLVIIIITIITSITLFDESWQEVTRLRVDCLLNHQTFCLFTLYELY